MEEKAEAFTTGNKGHLTILIIIKLQEDGPKAKGDGITEYAVKVSIYRIVQKFVGGNRYQYEREAIVDINSEVFPRPSLVKPYWEITRRDLLGQDGRVWPNTSQEQKAALKAAQSDTIQISIRTLQRLATTAVKLKKGRDLFLKIKAKGLKEDKPAEDFSSPPHSQQIQTSPISSPQVQRSTAVGSFLTGADYNEEGDGDYDSDEPEQLGDVHSKNE